MPSWRGAVTWHSPPTTSKSINFAGWLFSLSRILLTSHWKKVLMNKHTPWLFLKMLEAPTLTRCRIDIADDISSSMQCTHSSDKLRRSDKALLLSRSRPIHLPSPSTLYSLLNVNMKCLANIRNHANCKLLCFAFTKCHHFYSILLHML